ncbi:MAG: tetratricopeptide repeat protein, partial [Gammaproteobacteria bacterium]|nr:tetratricopeptide repeat protein [Gammaproteobacteria bacterium]
MSRGDLSPEQQAHAIQLAQRLLEENRAAEAMPVLEEYCIASPENGYAWFLNGVAQQIQGELDLALRAFDRCLAIAPDAAQAIAGKATVLTLLERMPDALQLLQTALHRGLDDPQLFYNLGVIHSRQQEYEPALQAYDETLARNPEMPDARLNRGVMLLRLERLDEALDNNRRLMEDLPELAAAYFNQSEVYLALRRYPEALEQTDLALNRIARYPKAWLNRALALSALGRLGEARYALRQTQALAPPVVAGLRDYLPLDAQDQNSQPDPALIFLHMAYERQEHCDWSFRDRHLQLMRQWIGGDVDGERPTPNWTLSFQSISMPLSEPERLQLAHQIGRHIEQQSAAYSNWTKSALQTSDRKLRVAYLSADYRLHPVGITSCQIFSLHDREQFEIFGYSIRPDDDNQVLREVRESCDQFRNLSDVNDYEAARIIHDDGIDILVDLTQYTTGARTHIVAGRPAPIQVILHGEPVTMGAAFIDYKITDRVASPDGDQDAWCEKLVYLPRVAHPYDNRHLVADNPPSREQAGLPSEGFVFCGFTSGYKIDPDVFDTWVAILRRVEHSVLWLLDGGERMRANLRRETAARDIDPQRMVFAPRIPNHPEHLARYRLAGLLLDTFCCGAHTTAADGLWTGLPVLTLYGKHFASRLCASIVDGAGIP